MKVAHARALDYDKAATLAKSKAPKESMVPVVLTRTYGIRKIYDNYQVIAEIEKDARHRIRVAAGTLDGYRYVILREFYYSKREDTWKPGREGMFIPLVVPFKTAGSSIPTFKDIGAEFFESVTKAMEVAKTMPLADAENTVYIPTNYTKSKAVKAKEISDNEDL